MLDPPLLPLLFVNFVHKKSIFLSLKFSFGSGDTRGWIYCQHIVSTAMLLWDPEKGLMMTTVRGVACISVWRKRTMLGVLSGIGEGVCLAVGGEGGV